MTTIAPTTHPYSAPRTQPSPALGRPTPLPPEPLAVRAARLVLSLDASVQRFLGAADHNLGHLRNPPQKRALGRHWVSC